MLKFNDEEKASLLTVRPSRLPLVRLDSIMEIIDTFFDAICMGERAKNRRI
jgi:hypothetical protein